MVNPVQRMEVNSEEDKFELERVRRWKLSVKEIFLSVEDEYDLRDFFVYFAIGGSLRIEATHNKAKNQKKVYSNGERGFYFRTELQTDIKKDHKHPFNKVVEIEIRDSLYNLMKQHVRVELWEYNSLSFNYMRGADQRDLFGVVKGSMYQNMNLLTKNSLLLTRKEESGKN